MRFITDINNDSNLLAKFTAYENSQNELQSKLDSYHKGIEEVHMKAQDNSKVYFDDLIVDLKSMNLLPEDFSTETHGLRYDEESKHVWLTKNIKKN